MTLFPLTFRVDEVGFTLIEVMPASLSVWSSPASVTPSPSRSRQTRSWLKFVSWALTTPLPLVSKTASSSYPVSVAEPNSSEISSIWPLPLRSIASRPSSGATHAVRSVKPSPSRSKRALEPPRPVSSRPSPSRSMTSGSMAGGFHWFSRSSSHPYPRSPTPNSSAIASIRFSASVPRRYPIAAAPTAVSATVPTAPSAAALAASPAR